MKTRNFLMYLLGVLLLAPFTGCGNNDGNNDSVSTLAASKACIDCHAGNSKSISPVTGASFTADWMSSSHNTANGAGCLDCHSSAHYHNIVSECSGCHAAAHHNNGTSCSKCHGGSSTSQTDCRTCHANPHNDPSRCGRCHNSLTPVDVALKNPDAAGKCFACHKATLPAAHFRNMTAGSNAVSSAMYVTMNYEKSCNSCHDPHKGNKGVGQEHRDWARSGHGKVNSPAWATMDFKQNESCIRCHTSTGFINFIVSGYALPQVTWAAAGDKGREVATCKACHTSYIFGASSLRPVGAYTGPYGVASGVAKSFVLFSNQGESNICFPCHVGRENGDSLKAGNYNYTNQTFITPHNLGSAAVWQGRAGYKFYTSTSRYSVDRPTHGVLTSDLVGVSHSFNSRMTFPQLQKGSCVACHLGLNNNHSFKTYSAVKYQFNTGAAVTGCLGCHSGTNNGYDRYYRLSNPSSGFYALDRALNFLKWQFEQAGIYFNNDLVPYFFTSGAYIASVTDWTTQLVGKDNGNGTGIDTMGAAMNLKLLYTDRGAAAHNAAFTKAIIADSLVYLQHGKVGNRSSTAPVDNISFSAYSAAISPAGSGLPVDGKPSSISNLKSFLTSGGKRR